MGHFQVQLPAKCRSPSDLRPNFSLRPHFLSQCINSLKENRRELMFPFLPLEQKPTDKSVWNFASWAGSLAAFRPRLRLPLSRRPAEPRSPTPFTHSPPSPPHSVISVPSSFLLTGKRISIQPFRHQAGHSLQLATVLVLQGPPPLPSAWEPPPPLS